MGEFVRWNNGLRVSVLDESRAVFFFPNEQRLQRILFFFSKHSILSLKSPPLCVVKQLICRRILLVFGGKNKI